MKLPKMKFTDGHVVLRTRYSEASFIMNKVLVDLDRRTINRLDNAGTERVKLVDGWGKEILRVRYSHPLENEESWWNHKVVVGVFRYDKADPWCASTQTESRPPRARSRSVKPQNRDSAKSEIAGKSTT